MMNMALEGMMLCAALVSQLKIKNKLGFVHLGLMGMGVTMLLCGLLPSGMAWFWVFAVLCGLMGAGGNLYNLSLIHI